MKNKQIMGTASGIVESSLVEVSDLLLDVKPGKINGKNLPLILSGISALVDIQGGPTKFTVLSGEDSTAIRLCFIETDRANHHISIYGGWWFMGEYTISPHQKGSLLTYNLYNAAAGISGIFAGLMHRKELMNAKPALEGMLQRLGARLDCKAYAID